MNLKGQWFGIIGLSLVSLSVWSAEPQKTQELVFLNWADYMEPGLIKAFTERYQIPVKEVFFESDQARTEMLLRSKGKGYDVVLAVGMDVASYRKRGWLEPISEQQVPNLKHADPRWLNAFDKAPKGYAVPYLWGSLGILYRQDKIPYPIVSWKQLFQPKAELKGRIRMLSDVRDVLGLSLKALGYSYNSQNRQELNEVKDLLLAQKAFVGSYGVPVLTEKSGFVTGEYWIGMSFNGDALVLQALNDQLKFVIPEEGTGLWCDYLTVMPTSENKAAAFKFINFLNEPENAARLAQYLHYATTNQAAEKRLPVEYLNNPFIYPTKQVLERSETGNPSLPARIKKKRITIFNQLLQ